MMGEHWHGHMGGGGFTRTYGLHRHFSRDDREGPPPKIDRGELKRVAAYFRPYWREWLVILATIGLTSALNVVPPLCVGRIIDSAIPHGDKFMVGMLGGVMLGLAVIIGLIGVLQQTLTTRVGQNIMFDLRNQLYDKLQRMSLHFFTATRSGELVSRINNDVNAVQGVTTGTLTMIVSNIATLVITSATLLSMNWRLTLLALVVVPTFYLPSRIIGRIRRRLSQESQESQASLMIFLNERLHVGGSILTNIFGRRRDDADTFAGHAARVRDLNVKQATVGRWLRVILGVFGAAGPVLIYWYGGCQVIIGEMRIGQLVAFAALLGLFYRPLVQMASVYVDIQASFGVFDRIFEYLDLVPDVQDKPEAAALPRAEGHVLFDNVSFAYPRATPRTANGDAGGDAPPFALHDVSFEIRPGQQVALVGPSGAGKTTITYLVPRFYDPDAGRILLDGVDLRDCRQEDLRGHIGMVTQETFLFHASIRENLLYARPDASDEQMIEACQAASIHEFIAGLPDGYDTIVGERGFRLSGGEKQRVSIARALLKDPSILVLDEATSNLDATSEYLIQRALEKLLRGRTSLIIAHRLSTILSSDLIVVMDGGQVVQTGTHAELLERGGLYATLFKRQFGKVLAANGDSEAVR